MFYLGFYFIAINRYDNETLNVLLYQPHVVNKSLRYFL